MKKLLIGLLVLSSVSVFAQDVVDKKKALLAIGEACKQTVELNSLCKVDMKEVNAVLKSDEFSASEKEVIFGYLTTRFDNIQEVVCRQEKIQACVRSGLNFLRSK